jgi:BirA family biotin operon repressor/biotin-[acetyl-CoA-carboxylase] ligase
MGNSKHKPASNLLNDYHLLSFDSLDSTNEEAKRLAKGGGGHGAVIWAKKQTGGKGRLDRKWVSAEGNLFVSVLLKPSRPVHEFSQLSFVTAVAVHETLSAVLPEASDLTCKWPNDILLDGHKLGGILLESFKASDENGSWVVVGVGVNVDSFPPNTDFPATCLTDAGVELISAKIILSRFIHHFIERYDLWCGKGFEPIRKEWMSHAWGLGKELCARLPDKEITGIAEGIDVHGNLIMDLGDGKRQYIHAADVFAAGKEA